MGGDDTLVEGVVFAGGFAMGGDFCFAPLRVSAQWLQRRALGLVISFLAVSVFGECGRMDDNMRWQFGNEMSAWATVKGFFAVDTFVSPRVFSWNT
jgi:hypothetical protein